MNNKFDELTKNLAQAFTRRAALKKFGVGLAGVALACFGLAKGARAAGGDCRSTGKRCRSDTECCSLFCSNGYCTCRPSGAGCINNSQCCSRVCQRGIEPYRGICR